MRTKSQNTSPIARVRIQFLTPESGADHTPGPLKCQSRGGRAENSWNAALLSASLTACWDLALSVLTGDVIYN